MHFTFRLKYEGDWDNGDFNGSGKLTLLSGDVHEGQFVKNIVKGFGSYTSENGKYVGQWKDGKADGFGIFNFVPNNTLAYESYEGGWKANAMHGKGILIWIFGDRYEGQFNDNIAEGQGTYYWANGKKYIGQFRDNCNIGHGTLIFEPDDLLGRVRYEGNWEKNPASTDTIFTCGIMSGYGHMYWFDGTRYVGEFKNGLPNGYGQVFAKDGTVSQIGQWKNGRFEN